MKNSRMVRWAIALMVAGVAVGCGSSGTEAQDSRATAPSGPAFPAAQKSPESAKAPATGVVPSEVTDFKDDRGQLICPVMGTVIASPREAVASEVYNGKRYYFCCSACPPQFRSNPARFAEGRALGASGGIEAGAEDGHEGHDH